LSPDGRRIAEFLPPASSPDPEDLTERSATLTVTDVDDGRVVYSTTISGVVVRNNVTFFSPLDAAQATRFMQASVSLAFNAEGTRLAVVLSRTTNDSVPTSRGGGGGGLILGKTECELAVHDLTTGKVLFLRAMTDRFSVNVIALTPDNGRVIVSTGRLLPASLPPTPTQGGGLGFVPTMERPQWSVEVFDAATGASLPDLPIPPNHSVAAVSPDCTRIALIPAEFAGPDDVKVWPLTVVDAVTGQTIRVIDVPAEILNIIFSPNGAHVAGHGSNLASVVQVWKLSTGEQIKIRGNADSIDQIAFLPDGRHLVTLDSRRLVKIWDLTPPSDRSRVQMGNTYRNVGALGVGAFSTQVSADGTRSLTQPGLANPPNPFGPRPKVEFVVHDESGAVVAHFFPPFVEGVPAILPDPSITFSADGTKIAVCLSSQSAGRTGNDRRGGGMLGGFGAGDLGMGDGFGPGGGSGRGGLGWGPPLGDLWVVWDVTADRELRRLEWPAGQPGGFVLKRAVFSRDGRLMATQCEPSAGGRGRNIEKMIRIWNVQTGMVVRDLTFADAMDLAFSPDGRQVAIAGNQTSSTNLFDGWYVRLLDLTDGTESRKFDTKRASVSDVCFSPDGRWLAGYLGTGTFGDGLHSGGFAAVWDATAGGESRELAGVGVYDTIKDLVFSPDSSRLATLEEGTTGRCKIKVWDPATGQELLALSESELVSYIRFSADGSKLYVFDSRGRKAYDASPLPARHEALDFVSGADDIYKRVATLQEFAARLDSLTLSPELKANAIRLWSPLPQFSPLLSANVNDFTISLLFRPDADGTDYGPLLQAAERLKAEQPESDFAWMAFGGALYRLGRYNEALAALARADELTKARNGSRPSTLAFLSMAHHRLNEPKKAQETLARLRDVLKSEPWSTRLAAAGPAGLREDLRGFYVQAEQEIAGRVAQLDFVLPPPDNMSPNTIVFRAGLAEPEYTTTLQLAAELKAVNPDNAAHWLCYGGALFRLRRYDDALTALTHVRDLDPNSLPPTLRAAPTAFLAMTYQSLGQTEKAKQELVRLRQELQAAPIDRLAPLSIYYGAFYAEPETLIEPKK
jgi:WD40 repeat protein